MGVGLFQVHNIKVHKVARLSHTRYSACALQMCGHNFFCGVGVSPTLMNLLTCQNYRSSFRTFDFSFSGSMEMDHLGHRTR